MEQVCEIRKKLQRVSHKHIKVFMTIQELCQHVVGKTILACETYTGEDILILELDDGSHIEISGDSLDVYAEVILFDS